MATKATGATKSGSFRCTECGWQSLKWVGRCAECQAWGTVISSAENEGIARTVRAVQISDARIARPITEISSDASTHWATGIGEFDRVLGGGLVPGASI